jgi:DNA topoisomerase-1
LAAAVEQDERAAAERLVYVDDSLPGWRRLKRGAGFCYVDQPGRAITDADQLRRIRRLAIPPAYTQVWICPLDDGHIQATGRDARGRKQYRYHELWQALRGATKFARMREFGLALPRIRRRVQRDLALRGLPREKVLATIVRLLDTTYLRVGNDEYARTNGSFGLTTLRNRHVAVKGGTLRLSFRGKSGVHQRVELDDPQIARICARLQELPGQELFQCVDEDGEPHTIGSADVNDYIAAAAAPARPAGARGISGPAPRFTAKDFRTWHASALALERLHPCQASSDTDAKRRVKEVIAEVARQLGHTLSVCRKSYVHPDVLSHFAEGRLQAVCEGGATLPPGQVRGLKPAEKQLLALLSAANRPVRSAAPRPARTAPAPKRTQRRQATAQTTA